MKHHTNLNIIDEFNVTGRGTVFVMEPSIMEVYTKDTFEYKGKNYQIISIEGFRVVEGISKNVGLIVKEINF